MDASARIEWDGLLPGAEIGALVLMASGFALADGQQVAEDYRVVRRLGEGGMGQVLAVQLLGTQDDTTYALKVVGRSATRGSGTGPEHPPDSDAEIEAEKQARWFAELLRSEAAKQEVAQRHGVAVARLFALVRFADGSLGLRMELARGHSLEGRIAQQKRRRDSVPDAAGAIRAVRKLLSQLRRLHEMVRPDSPFGFVHSDIKPGNVFVDDADSSDVIVTLLDFGVATAGQALEQNLALARGRSRKTLVLEHTGGTLGYVPPYHFTMQATPLADVYASLVILYELVTLALPWDLGPSSARPGVAEFEAAMLRGPRPVHAARASIPDEDAVTLDAFFAKEFRALNELASHASQALATQDEDVRHAIGERLRTLARDYQPRLDRLLAGFGPTRRNARPSLAPAGESEAATPEELATRPTMLSDGPGHDGEPGTMGPGLAADESWSDASVGNSRRPTAIEMPADSSATSSMDRGMTWGDTIAPAAPLDERPASPMNPDRNRGGRGSGWIPLVALPLCLAGGWMAWRALHPSHAATTLASPTEVDAAVPTDASVPMDVAVAAIEPDAGRHEVAVPTPGAARHELATAGTTPDAGGHAIAQPVERPTPSAGANTGGGSERARCRCVAPARGVMVVARGGTLHAETTLCVATSVMPQRSGHFVGNGELPADFARAHATLACRGPGVFDLAVLSYPTEHGEAALYECSRAESTGLQGPVPVPTPAPTPVPTPAPTTVGPANAAPSGVSFTPLPGTHGPNGSTPAQDNAPAHPAPADVHGETVHHESDAGG